MAYSKNPEVVQLRLYPRDRRKLFLFFPTLYWKHDHIRTLVTIDVARELDMTTRSPLAYVRRPLPALVLDQIDHRA